MKKGILLLLAIVLIAVPSMAEMLNKDGKPMTLADFNAGGKSVSVQMTKQINEHITESGKIPTTIEGIFAVQGLDTYFAKKAVEDAFLVLYEPGWINNYGDMNPFTVIVCARFGSQCFITTSTTMETKTITIATLEQDLVKWDREPINNELIKRIEIIESYKGLRIINSWYY